MISNNKDFIYNCYIKNDLYIEKVKKKIGNKLCLMQMMIFVWHIKGDKEMGGEQSGHIYG